jgi:UDP:flavonoid glycosyltransferase YjiC (YdhE family)
MNKGFREQVVPIPQAHLLDLIESLGGKLEGRNFFFEIPFTLPDRVLQMCIPSVEYPRSDAPNTIKFTGGLPKGKNGAFENPPPFWDEVVNNKTKKIIAVCQGTIAMDYNNLVIPTLKALKDRDDILVVVALGRKGMTLPKETEVPANARISDYIPYDDLLPHCSIFITNGGYGSFQHSVANGTPLIVGGDTEDKPEVAARAEWAGNGYNLRSGRPTVEAIEKAVNEVLTNSKYKNRALELQAEMATYDPTGEVIETIEELAAQTGN